jgi:hypothetical protein
LASLLAWIFDPTPVNRYRAGMALQVKLRGGNFEKQKSPGPDIEPNDIFALLPLATTTTSASSEHRSI